MSEITESLELRDPMNLKLMLSNSHCQNIGHSDCKVHPGFIGRPYRYCYVVGWVESINRGHFANAVTKVDMETGETTAWRGDEFQHPAGTIQIAQL